MSKSASQVASQGGSFNLSTPFRYISQLPVLWTIQEINTGYKCQVNKISETQENFSDPIST